MTIISRIYRREQHELDIVNQLADLFLGIAHDVIKSMFKREIKKLLNYSQIFNNPKIFICLVNPLKYII
jgi:acetylornithine/succinyldiaminopimelate/putrescine aminotransferase